MNKEHIKKTLTIAGYSINGLIALMPFWPSALVTLLSAYGGMVNPDTTALPAMIAMTFPLWLVLSVIALLADLFVNRYMAVIPAVTIGLSLGPVLSYCPLNLSHSKLTPEEDARSFTLMSYNVYGLNDYLEPYSPKDSTRLRAQAASGHPPPPLSSPAIPI